MPSLATFNANNFFLRYRFADTYPGDLSRKSKVEAQAVATGYLPGLEAGKYAKGRYVVWDATRRKLAAKALKAPDNRLPDIVCFQEVENIQAIRVLNQRYLDGAYGYSLLIDGYDPRNIDVGVLSRFPIIDVKSHIDEGAPGARLFSRDCLEATIELPGGALLTLLVNHLKSKFIETKKGQTEAQRKAALKKTHLRREAQAKKVAKYVEERFAGQHETALYAVVGDFNDTPDSLWVKPIVSSPRLTDVLAAHRPIDDRWTYYWRAKRHVTQIDYVLASKALAARIAAAVAANPERVPYIERRGLGYNGTSKVDGGILPKEATLVHLETDGVTPDPGGVAPPAEIPFRFPRYKPVLDNVSSNTSDHCPVKVWF